MEKRYQVFVSSTFADLKDERRRVIQTLLEMDCIPSGMEIFPAADEEQWEFIKKVITDCDYYILIIGGRYGSITPEGISYTEKEYDYAVSIGLKVLAFLHEKPDDIPFKNSEKDPYLRQKLNAFRYRVSQGRLVKFWNQAEELPGLVSLSLSKTIKKYPAVGWIRSNLIANSDKLIELNDKMNELVNDIEIRKRFFSQFGWQDAAINVSLSILLNVIQDKNKCNPDREDIARLLAPLIINRSQIFNFVEDDLYNFAVYIFDKNSDLLNMFFRTCDDRIQIHNRSWKRGVGHVGIAFEKNMTIISGDIFESRVLVENNGYPSDANYYRSLISVPIQDIQLKGKVPFGIFTISSNRPGHFNEAKRIFVEIYSLILSIYFSSCIIKDVG